MCNPNSKRIRQYYIRVTLGPHKVVNCLRLSPLLESHLINGCIKGTALPTHGHVIDYESTRQILLHLVMIPIVPISPGKRSLACLAHACMIMAIPRRPKTCACRRPTRTARQGAGMLPSPAMLAPCTSASLLSVAAPIRAHLPWRPSKLWHAGGGPCTRRKSKTLSSDLAHIDQCFVSTHAPPGPFAPRPTPSLTLQAQPSPPARGLPLPTPCVDH